jgi:hypothetical protein
VMDTGGRHRCRADHRQHRHPVQPGRHGAVHPLRRLPSVRRSDDAVTLVGMAGSSGLVWRAARRSRRRAAGRRPSPPASCDRFAAGNLAEVTAGGGLDPPPGDS